MRMHVVDVVRPETVVPGATLDRVRDVARRVEEHGFAGLWVADTFGRGEATLDPIVQLTAVAAVTHRLEIGSCVLQVPVRHPVEQAHRVAGLHALAGARLQLGLGSGSTQDDFDVVGADFADRFKAFGAALDMMDRAWRGAPLPGGRLTPWPGTETGPSVLLGAWRSRRWITLAAEQYNGWIASGKYAQPEELEASLRYYRDTGGKRAVLANVIMDPYGDYSDVPAAIKLTDDEDDARRRLRWIRDIGFDDVLCVARPQALDSLARLRDSI